MAFNPQPKPEPKAKKGKVPLKRTALKKQYKPTGEMQIFEDISEEREWRCFVTGAILRELTPSNFLHVLPKALNKFPRYNSTLPI